jgi:hypothetical protein
MTMTMTLEDVEHLPVEIRYVGEVLRKWASLKGTTVDQWAVTADRRRRNPPHVRLLHWAWAPPRAQQTQATKGGGCSVLAADRRQRRAAQFPRVVQ